MQGGHLTSPAKSDWISIIWTGLSLLQEQGGYYSLAGRINRTIASIGVMDLVRPRVTVTSNSPLARGELLRLAGVARRAPRCAIHQCPVATRALDQLHPAQKVRCR